MVLEVEAVDGVLRMQAGHAETALDSAAVARVQFKISERLQCVGEAQVLSRGISDHLIELLAHRRQTELVQFQMQRGHKTPFGIAE